MKKILILIILLNTGAITPETVGKIKEVPILCYHNIFEKEGKPGPYYISAQLLEEQIKYFKENGYVAVLPEDIYRSYIYGLPLPEKSVMFSFDDTRKDHYTLAAPLLEKYGYKGAFFIMTVAIGKKNYMTKDEIRDLARRGHCIGNHTYDHQNLKKLPEDQWKKQVEEPKKKLEDIIGINVCYLAYPFGLCNEYAAEQLEKRGIYAAFQLSGKSIITDSPLFIRRLLVTGSLTSEKLAREIKGTFH
ncbi:MAG: polysaccharide deacetylase family protein [Saprospiraceae bacterium]|jgi:peptidoglycan/xylan/chitin deacetylase (PgdA/CDA1 family)|nr:polysaccharide deacetylase family protein [Saprospiraceae bacterium]